ncbi:hypothetical protein [Peribacillus sp. FSL E2-0218]|uniref:hypothetical protein n=1 Tax=Peribacillus sp. FSL E2-0218 TaxID=2921364 RepID=UPI0030EE2DE6
MKTNKFTEVIQIKLSEIATIALSSESIDELWLDWKVLIPCNKQKFKRIYKDFLGARAQILLAETKQDGEYVSVGTQLKLLKDGTYLNFNWGKF